jgi:hypothetical protein
MLSPHVVKNRPGQSYHALGLLHINLVANDDKGKVLRSTRRGLDQELVSPALQGLETLCVVDIVHEHTAVGSAVERNSQGLETFLSGSVPNLSQDGIKNVSTQTDKILPTHTHT